MADEKQLSFSISVKGASNEAVELAKLEVHLKNLTKAKNDLIKVMQTEKGNTKENQIALANLNTQIKEASFQHNNLKKVVDTAGDSLARMKKTLAEMKQAANEGSQELKDKLAPAIKKLNDEISKSEQAQGTFSRNVGNYAGAIGQAVTSIVSIAAPAAAATYALNELKEAFAGTERGANLLGRAKLQMSAFFDSIVEGKWGYAFGNKLPKDIKVVADLMNKIRIDDRKELVEIAKMELEIKNLRIDAVKAGQDSVLQVEILRKAEAKTEELIQYKLDDRKEELRMVDLILEKQPTNTSWLNRQAQLQAEINDIMGERSLRIASTLQAAEERTLRNLEKEKAGWEAKDANKKEYDITVVKEKEKADKEAADKKLQQLVDLDEQLRKNDESEWKRGMELSRALFEQNKKDAKTKFDLEQEAAEKEIQLTREKEKRKSEIEKAILGSMKQASDAFFTAKMDRSNALMTAELANENLTESQKGAIKRKYAKEQQKIQIGQALINGALGIVSSLSGPPIYKWIEVAAVVAATAIQVAAIKAQKFAKGGRITQGVPVDTGTKDDTLIVANRTETVLTQDHVRQLGGSAAMRRIKVPGYEMGGYVGQRSPEIPSNGFDYAQLANLINSKEVFINVNKINEAQNEVEVITQTQKI